MKLFTKDGRVAALNSIVIVKDDMQFLHPTEDMVLEDGWTEVVFAKKTDEELKAMRAEEEADLIKNQLTETDYKIIKCMEAFLCKEPLPYDIEALHSERNAQRAAINELLAE